MPAKAESEVSFFLVFRGVHMPRPSLDSLVLEVDVDPAACIEDDSWSDVSCMMAMLCLLICFETMLVVVNLDFIFRGGIV